MGVKKYTIALKFLLIILQKNFMIKYEKYRSCLIFKFTNIIGENKQFKNSYLFR